LPFVTTQHLAYIYSSVPLLLVSYTLYPIAIMFTPLYIFTVLPLLVAADPTRSRTVNPALNAQLKAAVSNFDRQAILSSNSDWVYDFSLHPNFNSPTGAVLVADAASFPALTTQGMTISMLKLAGCGMLPPHLHPRATNLVTAITGNTTTYMIGENGVKTVVTELTPMKMTIFPAGSLHTMQNNGMLPPFLHCSETTDVIRLRTRTPRERTQ
jgi:hypothetical protein